MNLDITRFIRAHREHMHRFSDSIARSGLQNIGEITWQAACAAMTDEADWLTSELGALVDHFRAYGAWDAEELAAMPGSELNALLVHFIAGDWQERERARARGRGEAKRWEESSGGRICGSRGRWYYYVGM